MTTHRPTPVSAVLSVAATTVAVALVAAAPGQRFAIGVTVAGLVPVALGLEARHRGHLVLGLILALVGTGIVAGGIGLGYMRSGTFSRQMELLPGLAGLYVQVLGLGPLRQGRERLVFSAGTGLVMVAILTSTVLYETTTMTLLIAGILTVLAWDLAEQSVNLGEQVGRETKTYPVELVHGSATLAVGGGAILLTRQVSGANVQGLPLIVLAGLLAAAFTLAVTLYN